VEEGEREGRIDGVWVGIIVGAEEGTIVVRADGEKEGSEVGLIEGIVVGI